MSSFSRRPATTRRPSDWESTRSPPPPQPLRSGRAIELIAESGGAALVDAQEAFIDSTRAVWTRIVWSLPSEHDMRVLEILERIGRREIRDELVRLGVDRYLQTGRGAIFCNAGYNAGSELLAVDWVTFRDAQMTRDKLLQQDVLLNDPASSVLVYVFRLASDRRWIALWRQRIRLPSEVTASQSNAISRQKKLLAEQEQDYVIKISYPVPEEETAANRALALFEKTSPDDLATKARVYDVLGCALRQRYIYLADADDCRQSIAAHRTSLALTPESTLNSTKASRKYHLSAALFMQSRGLFSISASSFSREYAIEATHINGQANRLVGNSKASYALMHSNLLLVCASKVVSAEGIWTGTDVATLEQKLTRLTTQTIDKDPYQNINNQFGNMNFESLIQHITFIHKHATQLAGTRHMHAAAFLGQFSACLVGIKSPDDARGLDFWGSEVLTFLSSQSSGLDLRHVTHLMDILEAIVELKEKLQLGVPGLIDQIAASLDAVLPPSHMERPQFHYLLGSSLCADQSELLAHGSHAPNYTPAIEQHRKALRLTPDWHPSQAKYLLGLIRTLWLSAWPGSMSQSNLATIHQEIRCWSEVLDLLDQDLGFQPGFSAGPTALSRLLSLSHSNRGIDVHQALEAFASIEQMIQVSISAARSSVTHRKGLAELADMMFKIGKGLFGNDRLQHVSRKYLYEAQQIWQYLQTRKLDANLSQATVEFGLGSTLVAQADQELAWGNFQDAYRLFSDGIAYMEGACVVKNLATQSEIENLAALAYAYARRHLPRLGLYNSVEDLEIAVDMLRQASAAIISLAMPAKALYDVCKVWVFYAVAFEHESALEGYDNLVGSVARLAWIGVDVQTRYERLQDVGPTLAADAAVYACLKDNPYQAASFLETGRAILFAQALPLRNRYVELRATHPEVVLELERLGRAIEEKSFGHGRTSNNLQSQLTVSADQINREAYELHRLGEDWDRLVTQVRSISGYEHFLRTPPLEDLCLAATNGPVVFVATSSQHKACFAIAILGPSINSIQSVRLPATPEQVDRLSHGFNETLSIELRRMRFHEPDEARGVKKAGPNRQYPETAAHNILAQLWHLIMKPIVELVNSYYKGQSMSTFLPRMWLSATGVLSSLPLHAAGIYNADGTTVGSECVLDHVVCSYTPSLSALLREPPSDASCSKVYAFSGGEGLYQTSKEVRTVKSICDKKAIVNIINCSTTSSQHIREALYDAHIAHFACHGIQDLGNPLKSRLSFSRTCEIDLETLMQDSYVNASLAVLLACETAQGDRELTEESLHIAGTMLFAGFRGAVGNLWKMADQDGPTLCSDFYQELLEGNNDTIQYRNAGRALHKAVCKLKRAGASVFRWATFIHIGQ
ncbi:hypothetical protein FRC07_012433 [Ceratobasidium sp. 392]|nr:hypothetical protein FRC07_012433 [Ceratobasidium sp. 392]